MDRAGFLAERMADPATQWSLGTFGAIAEFARDRDEPVALDLSEAALSAATLRGAIRIATDSDITLFASESPTKANWSQLVALCLPQDRCAMHGAAVLTELGPDAQAVREQDRGAILFDLGLDALQADFCVRTSDRDLVERLRACVGRPVFESGNPAMGHILATSPHRVFISRIGRIEVFQPIPPAHGKSPEGPHTHVLPKLLAHRRTHPATQPLPAGLVPCAHCYPDHPVRDGLGHPRPFDPAAYSAFQAMLQNFGDPDAIALKREVSAAVAAGAEPTAAPIANKRFGRAGIRVALRQLAAAGDASPALTAWRAAHDGILADSEREDDAEPYAH